MRLITVGHGTASENTFVALLHDAGVENLVDVRTVPGSKRHPHFRREAMERWIPAAGLAYRWEPRLGGFRKPDVGSRNVALRHPAFRGYADHMRTSEFSEALNEVLNEDAVAVMCSESVWWKCHRRLLSDAAAILGGSEVVHLMHDGRLVPHVPTEGVCREGDLLVYDGGQRSLAE
jgi:uncharacterized protein (DUF488 family)